MKPEGADPAKTKTLKSPNNVIPVKATLNPKDKTNNTKKAGVTPAETITGKKTVVKATIAAPAMPKFAKQSTIK